MERVVQGPCGHPTSRAPRPGVYWHPKLRCMAQGHPCCCRSVSVAPKLAAPPAPPVLLAMAGRPGKQVSGGRPSCPPFCLAMWGHLCQSRRSSVLPASRLRLYTDACEQMVGWALT